MVPLDGRRVARPEVGGPHGRRRGRPGEPPITSEPVTGEQIHGERQRQEERKAERMGTPRERLRECKEGSEGENGAGRKEKIEK